MRTTKQFALDTLERAGKTFLQVLAAAYFANQSNLVGFDWRQAALLGLSAAVASVLTSFGSAGVGEHNSPSLVSTAITPKPITQTVVVEPDPVVAPDLYGSLDSDAAPV